MTAISINRHIVNDGVLRLAVTGEVDAATCDLLVTTIRNAIITSRVAELIVDLGQVTFLDASGINALVQGYQLAAEHGVAYLVTNSHETLHDVMNLTAALHTRITYPDPGRRSGE